MNWRILVGGLLLIGVELLVVWWLNNFELVDHREWVGFQGEARANTHLAAQRLATAMGLEADSVAQLEPHQWLPDTTDTLYLGDLHRSMSEAEVSELLGWVDAGGHLVAAPLTEMDDEAQDLLMAPLGVQRVATSTTDRQETGEAFADNDAEPWVAVNGFRISTRHDQPRLLIGELEPEVTARDDAGIVYFRATYGDGWITVLADGSLAENRHIGKLDNAAMLMTVLGYDSGKVWLVYRNRFMSLAALVWSRARYPVVALVLLLGLYLWRVSVGFGPRLSGPTPVRRSLLEHIDATGAYFWGIKQPEYLVNAARGAVIQRLERHHPGLGHRAVDEQLQSLAEHTGESAEKLRQLYFQDAPDAQSEFTSTMQALQRLWKKI